MVITTWDDSRDQNYPTHTAEEAIFVQVADDLAAENPKVIDVSLDGSFG
jgi:hypothetical protein